MQSRRKFISQTATAALGMSMISPSLRAALLSWKKLPGFGLQLYTLFPAFDDDVTGNLKKIADIGYKEIESAFTRKGGIYGMKPKEFAQQVKDAGMHWR